MGEVPTPKRVFVRTRFSDNLLNHVLISCGINYISGFPVNLLKGVSEEDKKKVDESKVAVKFFLEHDFRIVKLGDTGYTMQYAFEKNGVCCTIRPYSDRDFEEYAETLLQTWPCDSIQEARENVTQAVKRVERNENEEIWVAEVEGKAVGFILIGFTEVWGHRGESFGNEAVGVDWFDVHPKFQRRGIGKDLLQKAEERGREKGLHHLFMHTSAKNLSMINFASMNGFRFEKYLEEFWGKGTGDAFLLVKQI